MGFVAHIEGSFRLPRARVISPPVFDVGRKGRTYKAIGRAVGTVVKADVQRDQPIFAEIEFLLGARCSKSRRWISRPYFRWPSSSRSKPGMNVSGAAHSDLTFTLWRGWYQTP